MRVPSRLILLPAVGVLLVGASGLTACGANQFGDSPTLPPIKTTTTLPPTSSPDDPYYEHYTVKPGDNLALIARSFNVPLSVLIEANKDRFRDKNNVPVGTEIVIPPHRIIDKLPTTPPPTSSP